MFGHCEGSLVSVAIPRLWEGVATVERGAERKRVKRKEGKDEGEGRAARISERRVSRIPLSPPSSLTYPMVGGGYRLTAIRLNLFHHKRLNKEVHSSARANHPPSGENRPARYPYRPLSTTHDHPSGSLPSLVESFDERDSSFPIVPPDFFAIQSNPLAATGITESSQR